VMRSAPYSNQTAKEALDAVLTGAAFEIPLALLFMDDGVYQLLPEQNGTAIHAKNLPSTLSVLPMYDVEKIYVEASSLIDRGIKAESLILPVEVVDSAEVKALFADHDQILSF
ncbi:MAG: sulfurtransferase complex subunit TusC, partial [Motiliproteus sp.]